MATESPDVTDREYANHELLDMDEETARETLTVVQFERWESLQDIHAQADETRQEWQEQSEEVADLTVHADPSDLGTEVDLYGNDIVVHIDSDDGALQETAEEFESLREEYEGEQVSRIDDDDRERMATLLTEMYDTVLLDWNGTRWPDLDEEYRHATLAEAREKWGFDDYLLGWLDISEAIYDDREQRMEMVEKFRDPERRGNR